ncbi:hypothetical protein EDB84DRAFT_310108 [Lactarius hengduanensis]|nr:hypothetical protein EDB84DRAFT_310108 [Lactarius hengduanensis]
MEPPVHDLRQTKRWARLFRGYLEAKQGQWLTNGVLAAHQLTSLGQRNIWCGVSLIAHTADIQLPVALPSIHPGFSIPTEPNGGNHTPAFTSAAATPEAHQACLGSVQGTCLDRPESHSG